MKIKNEQYYYHKPVNATFINSFLRDYFDLNINDISELTKSDKVMAELYPARLVIHNLSLGEESFNLNIIRLLEEKETKIVLNLHSKIKQDSKTLRPNIKKIRDFLNRYIHSYNFKNNEIIDKSIMVKAIKTPEDNYNYYIKEFTAIIEGDSKGSMPYIISKEKLYDFYNKNRIYPPKQFINILLTYVSSDQITLTKEDLLEWWEHYKRDKDSFIEFIELFFLK